VSSRDSKAGAVGLGVITCNRPGFFGKCIQSIPRLDCIVVINDGESYPTSAYPSTVSKVIQHSRNRGIGVSKNEALRFLLAAGCEHLFLCEEDIRIKDPRIFQEYVDVSTASKLPHLNFGLHGPANKNPDGSGAPRAIAVTPSGVKVAFYRYPVGAFSYYHKSVLLSVGFMDEFYKNFHEHVDHTVQMIKRKLHPPYGWFPDINQSDRFIEDLDPRLEHSSHRNPNWLFLARNYGYFVYYTLKNGKRREASSSEFLKDISTRELQLVSLHDPHYKKSPDYEGSPL